ncbi:MAG TPA: Sec-independent protein translocase subunit TatA [Candidatus Corynebacterium intestinavium]|uniref:Sec-independent protein translocase protein TatA n=1 Tax=Candidatus Corynebacterium intestinavium TaxID=2838531 RepID=A0A9D2UA64_9CORY|nr:Sec-independent protein translocase subunit TatA [Candidatus Corynebacterium intestinavium]
MLSGSHILILLLVVLLVFGASRLPNAARSLGRSMRIFKSEMDEMRTENPEQNEQEAIEQQRASQPNPAQQVNPAQNVNPAQQQNQNSN